MGLDASSLVSWLQSPQGNKVLQLDDRDLLRLAAAIKSLTLAVPSLILADDRVELSSYSSFWIDVVRTSDGEILLAWISCKVDFDSRWANPMWSAVGSDLQAEAAQIISVLSRVVATLPEIPAADLDLAAVALSLPSSQRGPLTRVLRSALRQLTG